jgi:CopG family nickel-responsive transcriptional regulator
MAELARIGVAISEDLLQEFDRLIERRGYTNRSEAFRDLIRNELVNDMSASGDAEVCGAITLIYDHHVRMLSDKLNDVQHEHYRAILSTVHVHLDHDNCLEVVLVRGKARAIEKLANSLIATKGVKHGRYALTASAGDLP